MKFCVRPAGTAIPDAKAVRDGWIPVELFATPTSTTAMTAGASILTEVRRARLEPTVEAWDLLTVALSAIVADAAATREESPDGWTRQINLDIALNNPDRWSPHVELLETALRFLTTDIWKIEITERAPTPFTRPKKVEAPKSDCVALLSGGVDSLVGAIDLKAMGREPFFVSQTAQGDAAKQDGFPMLVSPQARRLRLNHSANTSSFVEGDERTQRARSLVFIAYGALVASTIKPQPTDTLVDLYVNENGFIAVNPPLTPLRVGSLSTRTAHPRFLGLVQELVGSVGLPIRISNPYRMRTKGQMLAECQDQALLASLVQESTSCGRYLRYNYNHCGRCIPCQVRRAAFLHWGVPDATTYAFVDLGRSDEDHAGFDDVRSVAMARKAIESDGFDYWVGNSLAGVPAADRDATASMLRDGVAELAALHDHYNVT